LACHLPNICPTEKPGPGILRTNPTPQLVARRPSPSIISTAQAYTLQHEVRQPQRCCSGDREKSRIPPFVTLRLNQPDAVEAGQHEAGEHVWQQLKAYHRLGDRGIRDRARNRGIKRVGRKETGVAQNVQCGGGKEGWKEGAPCPPPSHICGIGPTGEFSAQTLGIS
jgi:hypothetical protein